MVCVTSGVSVFLVGEKPRVWRQQNLEARRTLELKDAKRFV